MRSLSLGARLLYADFPPLGAPARLATPVPLLLDRALAPGAGDGEGAGEGGGEGEGDGEGDGEGAAGDFAGRGSGSDAGAGAGADSEVAAARAAAGAAGGPHRLLRGLAGSRFVDLEVLVEFEGEALDMPAVRYHLQSNTGPRE